jgi:hypothetical protein
MKERLTNDGTHLLQEITLGCSLSDAKGYFFFLRKSLQQVRTVPDLLQSIFHG